MKTLLVVILVSCFAACNTGKRVYVNLGGSKPGSDADLKIKAKDYLKSYAMCQCIEYGYLKNGPDLNERSTSFLKEMAEDLISPEVDSLLKLEARSFVYRVSKGSMAADGADKKLVLADCLFFSESKKMKKVIDSIVKKAPQQINYWGNK